MEWVKICMSAQRVLDQRYGKFGWAGMSIRYKIAVKSDSEAGPGVSSTHSIEILDEDVDSVFSSPRVRSEDLPDDDEVHDNHRHDGGETEQQISVQVCDERDERISADHSDHSDGSAPPSVDQISDGFMTASGPSSAYSGQAIDEKREKDIHAELDRLLGEKGKEKADENRAEPTKSMKIYLHTGASILKFIVEDLGHTTCEIDEADIIVFRRLHIGPKSLQSKNDTERRSIESGKGNQKFVSSQWLINCHRTCKTLDVKDFMISTSSFHHADDDSLGKEESLVQFADESDDSHDDDDEYRPDEVADSQLSESETGHQVYSVTDRPTRIRLRLTGTSSLKRRRIEMESTTMPGSNFNPSSNSPSRRRGIRRTRTSISKETRLRHLCKLLLAKPGDSDKLTYLRGCQPKNGGDSATRETLSATDIMPLGAKED
ncbi:hypothetical protein V866_001937 [Kwoniella sp. B9012]